MGCNCGGGVATRIFVVTLPGGDKFWTPDRESAGALIVSSGGGTATEMVGYAADVLKGQLEQWTPTTS